MTWFVSVHPLAREELDEAVSYYTLRSPRLSLAAVFEEAVDGLRAFPKAGAQIRGNVRRKLLRRFPYSILYRLHGDEVRILVFMHQKRRPSYWRGRV